MCGTDFRFYSYKENSNSSSEFIVPQFLLFLALNGLLRICPLECVVWGKLKFEQNYLQDLGLFCSSLLPKILCFSIQLLWMPPCSVFLSLTKLGYLSGFQPLWILANCVLLLAIKMGTLPHTIYFSMYFCCIAVSYLGSVIFTLVPWVVVLYYSVQSLQLFIGACPMGATQSPPRVEAQPCFLKEIPTCSCLTFICDCDVEKVFYRQSDCPETPDL